VTLSDLPVRAANAALRGPGLQLRVGPFDVRIRTGLQRVQDYLISHYREFPLLDPSGVHFDVDVQPGTLARRWLRRQAVFKANGLVPFVPVPERMAAGLFEWGLNWMIGRQAHQWLIVHAAVVEYGGRAAVLPAPPGSGKSTLCAALTFSGWRLLSDEFALIDPLSGDVTPVPRPISLKNRSVDVIGERFPDVRFGPLLTDTEGATARHAAPPAASVARQDERARVAWVVMPNWLQGAPLVFESTSRGRMLAHITDSSFNYNLLGGAGFARLAEIVEQSICAKLTYGSLDDALALFAQLTEESEAIPRRASGAGS
jgi:HprK-related kinase A